MTCQPTLPAIPWPTEPDPWRALDARLGLIQRAQEIARGLGNDEIGWSLRAALMAAMADVAPVPDLDDWNTEARSDDEVSSDLVEIVAHLEERARYAEDQRVRAETARRAAQSELRAAVARGVRLWEAGAAMASEVTRVRRPASVSAPRPAMADAARTASKAISNLAESLGRVAPAPEVGSTKRVEKWRERLSEWEHVPDWYRGLLLALADEGATGTAISMAPATGQSVNTCSSALRSLRLAGWLDRTSHGVYALSDEGRRRLPHQAEAEATDADEAQAVEPAAAASMVTVTEVAPGVLMAQDDTLLGAVVAEAGAKRRVASGSPDGVTPMDRVAAILGLLDDGQPRRTSEVAEALGQHERSVGDALYRLQRQGQVIKVDGRWMLDADEDASPDLLDEVVAILTIQGEPQPFEALVGRVGVPRDDLSAALNVLVRRGEVVADAGSYSLACQRPRPRFVRRQDELSEADFELLLDAILRFAHKGDEVIDQQMGSERRWAGMYVGVNEFRRAIETLAADGLIEQAGVADGVPYYVAVVGKGVTA